LAIQQHKKLGLEGHLRVDALGQGVQSVVPLVVEKMAAPDAKTWYDS